jgi:uncharacterized repeat protein (TIGR01451 family)
MVTGRNPYNRPVKFPLQEVQKMKKWMIPVMIAIIALLMPASVQMVGAQDTAGLSIGKSAEPTAASVGDNITYTYTITNTDNFTINNIVLEDDLLGPIDLGGETSLQPGSTTSATFTYTVAESDLPGPLVNTATVSGNDLDGNLITASATATVDLSGTASLQVIKSTNRDSATPHQTVNYTYTVTNNGNITINNLSLEDDKLGAISLTTDTLAPGQSTTATASYTISISDLPGPIVNTATVTGTGPDGQTVTAASESVSVSLSQNRWEWFKCEILKWRGVPGKGIEHAPGLQKPFNPKSQAAEHAGKKVKFNVLEQLQIREDEENQGADQQLRIREWTENQENRCTEEQLQIREELQNQAGGVQETRDYDQANPGKGQLKKNGNTDNQTVGQGYTGNGYKPYKDKSNGKSK